MSTVCECNKFEMVDTKDVFYMLREGSTPIVFDPVPTEGSMNLLTSGTIYNALENIDSGVTSVNGQTGVVVLDAEDIEYDSTEAYSDGSVGKEITTINSALSSLQSVTEIIDTASGAIASFPDGAGLPMRSLLATIEPEQDLHGQDAPYPAGSGANQFPYTVADEFTENGVTFKSDGQGKYTITGTCTGSTSKTFSFPSEIVIPDGANYKFCFMNSQALGSDNFLSFMNGSTTVDSWTVAVVNKESTYSGMSNKACTGIKFSVYSGTTYNMTLTPMFVPKETAVTSYIPYANICPISGWTGLTGKRCGKNLLPMPITSGSYANNVTVTVNPDLSFYISKPNGTNWTVFQLGTFLLKAGTYYLFEISDGNTNASVTLYDQADTSIVSTRWNKNQNFTLTSDTIVKATYSRAGQATDVLTKLLLTTTNSAVYEPYITPTTITCTWQTEAGTVYDGYIDVVSGELVATHGVDTYDGSSDEPWNIVTAVNRAYISVPSIKTPATDSSLVGILSNEYKEKTYTDGAGRKPSITARANITQINVFDDRITTDSDWRTFLASNPLQVVYPLAQPLVYHLSPQQISTLLGNNTVFVDCGAVSVTYQASIKGYIDKVLAS